MANDVSTAMYYTGIDPFTKKPVHIANRIRERKFQRALLQFFKLENYFEVRSALLETGRQDLIGTGCDCLIPARPPKEAISKRRKEANQRFRGEFVHSIPNPAGQKGAAVKKSAKQSRHDPRSGYRPR